MAHNRAAWIMAPMAKPFSIGNAPVYRPGPGEILIKAHSVAVVCPDNRGIINLLTMTNASSLWAESRRLEDTVSTHTSAKHVMSSFIWRDSGRYLRTYPFLLGRDAAGTVEEVGEGVTRFHKGQRVIASVSPKPNGLYPLLTFTRHLHSAKSGNPANAAYETYSVALEQLAAALPSHLSFEEGAVMPLAISTAAAGLYLPEYLGLPLPSSEPNHTDKTLLIWGGSSSVGATAIQLATASGMKVIASASQSNHDFVKSLGAVEVFDYKSPQVIQDLVARLQHSELVGIYDAIGETSSLTSLSTIVNHLARPIKSVTVHPFGHPTLYFAPSYGKCQLEHPQMGRRTYSTNL